MGVGDVLGGEAEGGEPFEEGMGVAEAKVGRAAAGGGVEVSSCGRWPWKSKPR